MGIKVDGKKAAQMKLNGKYIWQGKHNGLSVFKDKKFPGLPVLTQNANIPNVLQNNSDAGGSARTWSCTPFTVATSNVYDIVSSKWSIVSQSGFPNTLTINESTGALSCSCPAVNNGGGQVTFKLKYELKTRHGNVSVESPVITKQRIVAPYVGDEYTGFGNFEIITIGTAPSNATINYTGSDSTITSVLCPGLKLSGVSRLTTLSGTPVYTTQDWASTTGLAIPQSITFTNEAGVDTFSWTTERRLCFEKWSTSDVTMVKQGGKMGILSAKALALTAAEAQNDYNYTFAELSSDDKNTDIGIHARSLSQTPSASVVTIAVSYLNWSSSDLWLNTVVGWTLDDSTSLGMNLYTRRMSQIQTHTRGTSISGTLNMLPGTGLFKTNVYINNTLSIISSAAIRTKLTAALSGNLYVTG